MLFEGIKRDINGIKERDPAARNSLEVLLLYSGLHAIIMHRPAHWLYKNKRYFLARLISQTNRFFTGIEIHPGAKIGHGVLIDHGMGVVIGETATVGDNCVIYQGVTLGGTGKDRGKRHPDLEEGVMVGSGAKVLGPLRIGKGSKIAAGAVVLDSLPPQSTAVGVPAKAIRRKQGAKPMQQLDQIHIPDPVSQDIKALNARIQKLEKLFEAEMAEQTKQVKAKKKTDQQ